MPSQDLIEKPPPQSPPVQGGVRSASGRLVGPLGARGVSALSRLARGTTARLGTGEPHGHRARRARARSSGARWTAPTCCAATGGFSGACTPPVGPWRAWEARCAALVHQPSCRAATAGTFAQRWPWAGASRWPVRAVSGVAATQNSAERAPRCGGRWRTRRQGTWREQGKRGGERGVSFRPTCRLRGQQTLPLRVEAVTFLCKGQGPARRGITRQASLPACSTP